jgi:hypothetical protein
MCMKSRLDDMKRKFRGDIYFRHMVEFLSLPRNLFPLDSLKLLCTSKHYSFLFLDARPLLVASGASHDRNKQSCSRLTSTQVQGVMLSKLPEECRMKLYAFLRARDLCRLSCVCHTMQDIKCKRAHYLWKRLFELDILSVAIKVPRTCTFQRKNACSDFGAEMENDNQVVESEKKWAENFPSYVQSVRVSCGVDDKEEKNWSIKPIPCLPWPSMYCVCFQKTLQLHQDDLRFQDEMRRMQDLKRERVRLREFVARTSKNSHRDDVRRSHLSCVKFLNKTTRRYLAIPDNHRARSNKSELLAQLASVEESLQLCTSAVFHLRVHLRNDYRKLRTYLASARNACQETSEEPTRSICNN